MTAPTSNKASGQIENAIVNLAVNARDAMPSGGKLTIETGNSYLDETYANSFGDVKPGRYVMLSVTDKGTGITKQKLERIFEPFFTTKEVGKGTGLGLAMIYGFVKQSEGQIEVYSEVDHGTTVKIYLPRTTRPSKINSTHIGKSNAALSEIPTAYKGEVILLVEDDTDVREYAISVLEDLGHEVLVAVDGTMAIEVFKKAKRVDLLFTDVVLGGALNGRQMADAIKALAPELRVLFTTGYTRNAIIHQGKLDSDVNLLNKPYTQRDHALKLRSVLNQTQQ